MSWLAWTFVVLVNVTFGAIGFTMRPGLGSIVLGFHACSLDRKAAALSEPVWAGTA